MKLFWRTVKYCGGEILGLYSISVIGELFNKVGRIFKTRRENFLIIEQFEDSFRATKARLHNKDKKIYIFDSYLVKEFNDLKKPIFPVDKLVLSLNSENAVTIENLIRLKRVNPEELINEGELDTLVFRGLWEFLNHYRKWVVKKLKISDLDLVLAGAEIREVFLGSYRVFNPLGFKGAELSLRYRGTFIKRELMEFIEKLGRWGRELILVEDGSIIALSAPEEVDYLVNAGDRITEVFLLSSEECLRLRDLPWGTGRVMRRIADLLGTDAVCTANIVFKAAAGGVSKKIMSVIEKEVKQEVGVLFKFLKTSLKSRSRPVFCFNLELPLELTTALFKTRYIRIINFKENLMRQGYSVIIKHKKTSFIRKYDNVLALLAHNYFLPQYQFLNQLLTRRAKWLIAQS